MLFYLRPTMLSQVMSTLHRTDLEITQADGVQSSRVPVPLSIDPYVAARQTHMSSIDSEFEPEEAPSEPEDLSLLRPRASLESEDVETSEQRGVRSVSPYLPVSPAATTPLSLDRLLS